VAGIVEMMLAHPTTMFLKYQFGTLEGAGPIARYHGLIT
jgi:hypothetical protein